MRDKIRSLIELNKTLSPPEELCGLFLPPRAKERDDVLLLAEMPSMNEPKGSNPNAYNFGVTARDRFFQEMLVKYNLAGVYVTDIVKRRDIPRRPTQNEIDQWLPFLQQEIAILNPNMVIVIGRRTYDSFLRYVVSRLSNHFRHDFIFHYCSQVPRAKFEARLREVVAQYNLSRK
jgi:uracil-DNA glycosylase family 4